MYEVSVCVCEDCVELASLKRNPCSARDEYHNENTSLSVRVIKIMIHSMLLQVFRFVNVFRLYF